MGSSIRNVLGNTDSDNVDQLGDKITTDLQNKASNTLINPTENFINTQANELANSFGQGNAEISLHKIESNDSTYSIKTIQLLSKLDDKSNSLTFFQGQRNSGENHDEHLDTIKLGLGQRYLLTSGQSVVGINLFTDYEIESKHQRVSFGLEYQCSNFTANINKYYPLSDKVVISNYTEEPLAEYDVKLSGQVPYMPW